MPPEKDLSSLIPAIWHLFCENNLNVLLSVQNIQLQTLHGKLRMLSMYSEMINKCCTTRSRIVMACRTEPQAYICGILKVCQIHCFPIIETGCSLFAARNQKLLVASDRALLKSVHCLIQKCVTVVQGLLLAWVCHEKFIHKGQNAWPLQCTTNRTIAAFKE